MKRVQDISITDSIKKSEYVDNFLNENYNQAFELINDDNLETKRITSELIGNISDKLFNLENLYFHNVPEFLNSKLVSIQDFIDNLIFLGEWNASTIYRSYNLVSYNNSIYLYINEYSSQGVVPDLDTNSWLKLEINGVQGAPGVGLNYRGIWNSSLSYNQYDIVFYNDSFWSCKILNQNVIPQNNTYWDQTFKIYKAYIEEYSSGMDTYNGLICFEII